MASTNGRLIAKAETANLPPGALMPLDLLAGQFRDTKQRIDTMNGQPKDDAEKDKTAYHLQPVPGIGRISASMLAVTLPDMSRFRPARDLPAWLGLMPKLHSSRGKERLGPISKMGNRVASGRSNQSHNHWQLRCLLYLGTMGVISAHECSTPTPTGWDD